LTDPWHLHVSIGRTKLAERKAAYVASPETSSQRAQQKYPYKKWHNRTLLD
jgi:hypothetical protein